MTLNENSISDEVLQRAQEDIELLLKNKKISSSERVQLEIQSYFLMFLVSDHKKVQKIYPWVIAQQTKDEKRRAWWDKLAWVIIPTIATGVLMFLGQAIYFWIKVVPELMAR